MVDGWMGCAYPSVMGNSVVDHLKGRMDEARAKLEDARQRTAKAKADEEEALGDFNVYQAAYNAELKRTAGTAAAREAEAIRVQDAASTDLLGAVMSGDPVNKTQLVYGMIAGDANGKTPPEIYRGLLDLGLKVHRNYVYSILERLEQKKRVREWHGRYVSAEHYAYLSGGAKIAS